MSLNVYSDGELKKVAGYLDKDQYALKSELPTKTSELTNDSGYLDSTDLDNYYTKSEVYTKAEIDAIIAGLN